MSTSAQSTLSLPDLPGIEPGWELINLREPAKRGRFTGEQLARNDQRLAAVLGAIAEGLGTRQIARAFNISTNTVLALREEHGPAIETQKEGLGRQMLAGARLAVERIIEEIDQMPRASLPIVAGVLTDKGLLLTGSPTARIAHDHKHTVADVAEYIDALPSAEPVIAEETNEQKGALGLPVSSELLAVEVAPGESVRDSQSLVSAQIPEESAPSSAEVGQIPAKKEGST